MRFRGNEYRVDGGHVLFVSLIAAAIIWYLFDARGVSTSINNLLLIQPVAIFALAMVVLIIPQLFVRADKVVEEKEEEYDPLAPKLPTDRVQVIKMLTLGAALGVFVFALNVIGFDIAIFLFAAATMLVCGERRPLHIIAFSAAVAVVAIYGFRALMPYPMFTAIL
ncbi:tripartite tricarboxylate transporter TctB family protein [Flaviflagellibacter deserti]|jgi:hypothetical protein|uniref:Tripartite tricarboxylate transporter TctB family protein n=1 Tax=Flaviflagellibacter deserti TaxID=2267266 RepID=A0ABV9Z2Y8_9HYPH